MEARDEETDKASCVVVQSGLSSQLKSMLVSCSKSSRLEGCWNILGEGFDVFSDMDSWLLFDRYAPMLFDTIPAYDLEFVTYRGMSWTELEVGCAARALIVSRVVSCTDTRMFWFAPLGASES